MLFGLFRRADVSESEVLIAIEKIEKRKRQRGRREQEGGGHKSNPADATGKKLQTVQQTPGKQSKVTADRLYVDLLEPGLFQKVGDTVARIAKVIVRRLMGFPFVRGDQQQLAPRFERARQFPDNGMRLAHVLQRDDVDARGKGPVPKGQGGQIRYCIELPVVPSWVADRQIDSDIARAVEVSGVATFPRSCIEYALTRTVRSGERIERIVNSGFEMQDVTSQKTRQSICERRVAHVFLRASIMMVDPARQADSTRVKGSAATTSDP